MNLERDPTISSMKIVLIAETIAVVVLTIALCVAIFTIVWLSIELAFYRSLETVNITAVEPNDMVAAVIEAEKYFETMFYDMEVVHF